MQMLMAGWDAGLADDRRLDGVATDRLQRPTLLVIDNADLRTSLISALIDYLRWDEAGPPVRLLLLARAAEGWWHKLVRQQELDDSYTILDLNNYPVALSDRAEHFRRASIAFADHGLPDAQPITPPPSSELVNPAYDEPLLIHIAALLRTVGTSATSFPANKGEDRNSAKDISATEPDSSVRQRLLRALCERERARWYQLGEESHLLFNPQLPLVDQMVALATLTAADNQHFAASLLLALPNQAEVIRIGAEALVTWAHRLYAGPGYWSPLRPDLLAEQHLADTPQLSALVIAAAQLASGQRWEAKALTQLLAELTRGAPNQPAIQTALTELLATAVPRIVHLAITTDHAELADLASLGLQLAPQPKLAPPLVKKMPADSVRLAALAATLTSQQVDEYRNKYHTTTMLGRSYVAVYLAPALNNLAIRLSDVGQAEKALAASEESTQIYRKLSKGRPRFFATYFRWELAGALNVLSSDLLDLGREEEALAASQEATQIMEELTRRRLPTRRLRGDLAESLNTMSVLLGRLGRKEAALATIEKATGIYRGLAAARPDTYRPDLAKVLNNLSSQLADLGRVEEALAAIQEAVTIRRELAAIRPDVYRPDLADSLNNLAIDLRSLGRAPDALAASDEAVAISRGLAAARPDAYRPGLASSLNTLAGTLNRLSRIEEALTAIDEATELYRELALARPGAYRPQLAMALSNLSIELGGLGRAEEALAAIEEAVAICRELAAARPDAYRLDLAVALHYRSEFLGGLGRREEAVAAIEEAITIRRELAAKSPSAYAHMLEQSLRVADRLKGGENLEDAS